MVLRVVSRVILEETPQRSACTRSMLYCGQGVLSIPFRAMRGMRNIIAHDYGDVDLDLVWKTASGDEVVEKLVATSNVEV